MEIRLLEQAENSPTGGYCDLPVLQWPLPAHRVNMNTREKIAYDRYVQAHAERYAPGALRRSRPNGTAQ